MRIEFIRTRLFFGMNMEVIKSSDNKTVKHIIKLKQKKYRLEFGEFFVEGYKNVLDSASAYKRGVKSIVFGERGYAEYGDRFTEFDCITVSDALFEKITETENAQGVLAVFEAPPSAFPQAPRCVLLDRVRDPGNVGTILRTAVACGYDVVLNNSADVFSPKVTRSAMSAVVKCRIGIDIPPQELKKAGYELIVADMGGESVFGARKSEKYCLVIGNEADGVNPDITATADRVLSVPQDNMESLNAGVAAGIMMFGLRYAVK